MRIGSALPQGELSVCEVWKWIAISGAVPAGIYAIAWHVTALRVWAWISWMERAMRYWRIWALWLLVEIVALVILVIHCG